MHSTRMRKSFARALILCAPVLFLFAIILLITPATAQKIKQLPPPPPGPRYKPKPTPTPEYEVVRISSNLVVVPVSVTDAQGQPVLGLKQSEFHLEEDGRAQEITQLGDPEQVPLDIALLIDVSSSVSERFAFEEQAATRFLKLVLRPTDHATVYAIDRTPRLEQARSSADVAAARLLTIKAATGPSPTAFYDTVIEAARYLETNTPERNRRVIVVISDGEDNFSNRVRDSSLAAYRAMQADENDSSPAAKARVRSAAETALQQGHRKAQAEVLRRLREAGGRARCVDLLVDRPGLRGALDRLVKMGAIRVDEEREIPPLEIMAGDAPGPFNTKCGSAGARHAAANSDQDSPHVAPRR